MRSVRLSQPARFESNWCQMCALWRPTIQGALSCTNAPSRRISPATSLSAPSFLFAPSGLRQPAKGNRLSRMYLPEPSGTNGMRDLRHGTSALLPDKIGTSIPPWHADVRRTGWRRGAAVEFPQGRGQGTICRSEAQSVGKSLAGTRQRVRYDILLMMPGLRDPDEINWRTDCSIER
jgi:hypothetical protein